MPLSLSLSLSPLPLSLLLHKLEFLCLKKILQISGPCWSDVSQARQCRGIIKGSSLCTLQPPTIQTFEGNVRYVSHSVEGLERIHTGKKAQE
jgi:hypothetical protein